MYLKRLNSIKLSIAGDLNPLLRKIKKLSKGGLKPNIKNINH